MTSNPISIAFSNRGSGPYSKPIKCLVVAAGEQVFYKGQDGEQKQCLTTAVSDSDRVVKVIAYDQAKFNYLKVGQTVVLRETIRRSDEDGTTLVVTRNTKIFMAAPLQVPAGHTAMGIRIVNPPPAEEIPIKAALGSPAKKTSSVAGRIVQEEVIKTVLVRDQEVKIKAVTLEDTSDKAKNTLWRDLAECDVRPGDHIQITNVIVNVYNGQKTLQTTARSTVQKNQLPNVNKTVVVEGVSVWFRGRTLFG